MRIWPAACSLLLGALGCASTPAPRGESQTAFEGSIIDFHAHVEPPGEEGQINPKRTATPENLIAAMNCARVERSAAIVMARKGQLERSRSENDWVLAVAQKSSDRLFPIASVHPDDGAVALIEMERLQRLGVSVACTSAVLTSNAGPNRASQGLGQEVQRIVPDPLRSFAG